MSRQITDTLRRPDGSAYADVTVRFVADRTSADDGSVVQHSDSTTTTDESGALSIELQNGVYLVYVDGARSLYLGKATITDGDPATLAEVLGASGPVTSAVLAAVENAVRDRVKYVTDITALRALTGMQDGQTVEVVTTGRAGLFRWDASDLSEQVAADPQSGIYVAPDSDATGASGAWVRVYSGLVNAQWFGAVGDGITDDTVALQAFLIAGGGSIRATDAHYAVSSRLTMPSGSRLVGLGGKAKIKLAAAANDSVLYADGAENVEVSALDIDGNESGQTEQVQNGSHGVYFIDCEGVTLSDIDVHDTVSANILLKGCTRISVKGLYCTRSPADGLKLTNCHGGTFRDVTCDEYPYTATFPSFGSVAAVQVDDGSSDLSFENVSCTNSASITSGAGIGFDISSHAGEPEVAGITIVGLRTRNCDAGLIVQSATKGVRVDGHFSRQDRRALVINGGSENIRVYNVDYRSDADTVQSGGVGITLGQTVSEVEIVGGVVRTLDEGVMFASSLTLADRAIFRNLDISSETDHGLLIRAASGATITASFSGCRFEGADLDPPVLIGWPGQAYTETRAAFYDCEFVENAGANASGTIVINFGGVEFDHCKMVNVSKPGVLFNTSITGAVFRSCDFSGSGSTLAFTMSQPSKDIRVEGGRIVNYDRIIQIPAGSAEAITQNVSFDGVTIKDIASGAWRFVGTTDSKYLDLFTLTNNVLINVPTLFTGFPAGVNATNLVSYGNNPAITIPT